MFFVEKHFFSVTYRGEVLFNYFIGFPLSFEVSLDRYAQGGWAYGINRVTSYYVQK